MTTTPINSRVKVAPLTGKLPALWAAIFFCPRCPASARIGTIMKNRPSRTWQTPRVVFHQGVLVVQAGEGGSVVPGAGGVGVMHFAEPMRTVVVQPRHAPVGLTRAHAVKPRMMTVRTRIASDAALTS